MTTPAYAQDHVSDLRVDSNEATATESLAAAIEPLAMDRAELAAIVNAAHSRSHDTNVLMSVLTISVKM